MSNKIRLRFAPSPTGFLHIGSLRMVIFGEAIAKKLKGKHILRIEDTDQKREVPGAVEGLLDILGWAGLEFDEGPHVGGDYGPYTQTQRIEIYNKHLKTLLKEKKAYHCFCTPQRLEKMRQEQQKQKLAPRYDRCCRDLSEKEVKEKIKAGEKFVIRQKMPLKGEVVCVDELRGEIKFNIEDLEDHVLIKANGIPTYQFANVVDDHEMEISHVLRGAEWIPSFPKNILLYKDFGWKAPKFIHMPLTLNKEGGKLSKRQGDVAVEDYRKKGYLPEALINFCSLQGWHPKDDEEILSFDDIVEKLEIKDMRPSGAVFDVDKLDYFNGVWMRKKDLDELTKLCIPYLEKYGLIDITLSSRPKRSEVEGSLDYSKATFKNKITGEKVEYKYIKNVVELEQERLKKLSDIGEAVEYFFKEDLEYDGELLVWKKIDAKQTKENLWRVYELLEKIPEKSWTNDSIGEALLDYIKKVEVGNGDYLWPMRVALSGRKASPGPFDIAEVLGREETLKRIKGAIKKV